MTPPSVLMIGLSPFAQQFLRDLEPGMQFISRPLSLERLAEEQIQPTPAIVVCGHGDDEDSGSDAMNELAQLLRMHYQRALLFYITQGRKGYVREKFKKNGFHDAFLLPTDSTAAAEAFRAAVACLLPKTNKVYKPVCIVDITPGTVLGFDVYLHMPLNGKHIRFSSADRPLEKARCDRLIEHNVNSVHIRTDQIQSFYKFTASQLRNLNGPSCSRTEQRERRESAIRHLMSGLFSADAQNDGFERGREIMNDCKEIVKTYIAEGSSGSSWYEKLLANLGTQSSSYNHAANVATYAALFSIGTQIGSAEEMAIAGLLHDVGLADVDPAVVNLPESRRTSKQQKDYEKHVEGSLAIIKERKLPLGDIVMKAIAQHHERYDGRGYPHALPGHKICEEAQLLAFADEFDYATSGSNGIPLKSPAEVAQELLGARFSPEFTNKILRLFPNPTSQIESEVNS